MRPIERYMTDRYSTVAGGDGMIRFSPFVLIALAIGLAGISIHTLSTAPGSNRTLPGQVTAGHAVEAPAGTPDEVGQWGPVLSWPLVAVHGVLLNSGQALVWDAWEFGSTPSARLWNPTTQVFTPVPDPFSAMFCAGQVTLADGRELVAGGHNGGGIGIVNTVIFNPLTSQWTRVADMNLARWYPSATTLSDGRVLVLGGDMQNGAPATAPEVYDPGANTWTALAGAQLDMGEYPQTYPMPNGKIFVTAGGDRQSRILDVPSQTWTNLGFSPPSFGTSAMYLPGKVIMAAGGSPPNDSDPVTTTTSVIDLNQSSPAWRQTAPMAYGRSQHNLVLLPDGNVLAVGGAAHTSLVATDGVLPAELWSPTSETWTTMASLQDPRMYHSIALLLPDGRVLVAGGGRNSTAVDYPTAQVYSPPYLFKGPRPTITGVSTVTTYGGTLTVQTPDAATIQTVSFIRLASVTHTDNMDQRYIPLNFTAGTGSLAVQSPANANLAPPGDYMLFIVNTNGVPSVAHFVQIGASKNYPLYMPLAVNQSVQPDIRQGYPAHPAETRSGT